MEFPIAELDFDAGVMRIERSDGAIFEERLRDYGGEPQIRRLRIDYTGRRLTLKLPDGNVADVQVHLGPAQDAFLKSRPVVYLDQNHWSTIAAWRCGTRPVTAKEACGAEEICRLACADKIVLPVSGGHMVETGALYGRRRQEVACAVLQLSRGWLMRNPMWVRRDELATARNGNPGPAHHVFTLAADELFSRHLRVPDADGMPPFAAELTRHLINVSALYDTLVAPAKVPDEGGRAAVEAWGSDQAAAAARLRADRASPEMVWKVAHGRLLVDLGQEILDLWPETRTVDEWLPRSRDDVGKMPYLARLRAVMYGRLRNGSPWVAGDFNDVHYLSCAAGYADLVVGERRTIADLRRARKVPRGARLTVSLVAAAQALADLPARAQTVTAANG